MKTVWDEPKRERNLQQHRLDFADVDAYFDFKEAVIETSYPDRRGRARLKAIGTLQNKLVVLIFSPLGTEAIALVSLRPASQQERKLHEEAQGSAADLG